MKRQALVGGNQTLAAELAEKVIFEDVKPGREIVKEGADDDDLYMVVAGRVSVIIKGHEVDIMGAGEHFGEMVVIDCSAVRSASVFALEKTIVAKISETEFTKLAQQFPILWREIACRLGERLRRRNSLIREKNPRPVIFLGSSTESRSIVKAIEAEFKGDDVLIRPWIRPGIFEASTFPMETLENEVRTADFAVLVVSPEDKVLSRKQLSPAPRDNVVFELGLFMGSLTRKRTFLLQPKGIKLKIPSDLLGLTTLRYDLGGERTLRKRIRTACEDLRRIISRDGPK
jgi:CRP/FNR family transcriptional regulator, cyclic AMP receptor protein